MPPVMGHVPWKLLGMSVVVALISLVPAVIVGKLLQPVGEVLAAGAMGLVFSVVLGYLLQQVWTMGEDVRDSRETVE